MPLRCACRKRLRDAVIRSLKRQAQALVIVVAAGLLGAAAATADPTVASKQAQAQQVLAQIQQVDASMERAVNAYDAATAKLAAVEKDLHDNRIALHVARRNLHAAQAALAQRLVTIYTTGDETSALSVILGARSIDDLVNRVETVQSVTGQDTEVIGEVKSFKAQVQRREHQLVRARATQRQVVAARAAEKTRIEGQLAQRRSLLASIRGEIAHLQAMEQARQLALATQARARLDAAPPAQPTGLGVVASTPDATVAPPSQYGGVVGIAMRYLGVPYVWGGESPSGFDCSGLVAYVYAQVGVSLPHYTGAQWNAGVPVAKSDLQPGDLVFFNGLGHVGIYIGNGEMIHAPHTGDVVKISDINSGWYAATYVGARRIVG